MSESPNAAWPPLPWAAWQPTHDALHRWMQMVGKLKLACMPWTNHSWHVTFALTARGLGTGVMTCGERAWQAEFDFLAHRLRFDASDGRCAEVPLQAQSVADFHARVSEALRRIDIPFTIRPMPCEIPDAIPFDEDAAQRPYDGEAAQRFWRVLLQVDRVLRRFRARFAGKASPVHFFWGAMDLAVTRFSGRTAPPHPGGAPHTADWVMREAYSHEVSSCGFWSGAGLGAPAFYSYAYPQPEGFAQFPVQPRAAHYDEKLGEFVLPYEAVRTAEDPDGTLLAFLQGTYEAAATLANWDREALDHVLPGEAGTQGVRK
jgi:hypothetical protein